MEYTTDTTAAVEGFLAQKHEEALQNVANQSIDAAQLEFCAQLRELGGMPEDPALTEGVKQAGSAKESATIAAEMVEAKMDNPPVEETIKENRRKWLVEFISKIEQEHAAHGVLIELNQGLNQDQVEASTIAQLTIEGSHKAAIDELKSLS